MNIFYLDHDTKSCAASHVDKHCVKMILEYAQLLSTAHRVLDGSPRKQPTATGRMMTRWTLKNTELDGLLYTATHVNHPSAVWVRSSVQNYQWLATLLYSLCKEYTFRYRKIHKIEATGLMKALLSHLPKNIASTGFTQPTPAMPIEYKVEGDSKLSYRNYYVGAKSKMFAWKNRPAPRWIENSVISTKE
jgi:hypothetical protein